jgi:hypothetical protein
MTPQNCTGTAAIVWNILERMILARKTRMATMPDPTTPALASEWHQNLIEATVLAQARDKIVAEQHRVKGASSQ